ncbi:MAG: transglutaminase family protein [Chloroflexi bacterium]|nr:transglutaminase family protein [Chloroflexota bacterium]
MVVDRSNFRSEVRGPEPPGLARAALLFAREIAYPDLRPSIYLAQIDDWAEAVQRRLSPDDSISERVTRLTHFLFDDIGLRGNREDYADPRNSYLNEVMTRGLGLPISLSAIFLEVAQRIGLRAEGIGLPGHFIVAVHLQHSRRFLDPFNAGLTVNAEDAARLVSDTTGFAGSLQHEWFAPSPPDVIIARMLFNLRGAYVRREAWPQAIAVVEHLRILQTDTPDHLRDLGLLHFRNNSLRAGASFLEEYLVRHPAAQDAPSIRQNLAAVLEQLARLN